jgi:hypothetical protein
MDITNIPRIPHAQLDEIVRQCNSSPWFLEEFECMHFAAAVWYHVYAHPIFGSDEKAREAYPVIHNMWYYLFEQQLFEDEIGRDALRSCDNLTLILQAQDNRAIPLHGSMLVLDEHDERYILEKDGPGKVVLTPLAEWSTYRNEYPVLAAYNFHVAQILLGKEK